MNRRGVWVSLLILLSSMSLGSLSLDVSAAGGTGGWGGSWAKTEVLRAESLGQEAAPAFSPVWCGAVGMEWRVLPRLSMGGLLGVGVWSGSLFLRDDELPSSLSTVESVAVEAGLRTAYYFSSRGEGWFFGGALGAGILPGSVVTTSRWEDVEVAASHVVEGSRLFPWGGVETGWRFSLPGRWSLEAFFAGHLALLWWDEGGGMSVAWRALGGARISVALESGGGS
ncbi:hypothetical protein [Spirochaeta thermophila]|uniref:Outer membrane protein beta-barrel domain-containing protein n=1 Tax=Winmispira thermophila (strain ATCC 49972 / DSM 6192 / RI 19.B1) TaxID=665571 RepID=E0RQ04_WINT6|nr:hypothetical protein [Spirochaeta thermophila]ADN02857.1 hypothetical protein STHERM_c19220 [Spirochaeta thermophila DSM 6192]